MWAGAKFTMSTSDGRMPAPFGDIWLLLGGSSRDTCQAELETDGWQSLQQKGNTPSGTAGPADGGFECRSPGATTQVACKLRGDSQATHPWLPQVQPTEALSAETSRAQMAPGATHGQHALGRYKSSQWKL